MSHDPSDSSSDLDLGGRLSKRLFTGTERTQGKVEAPPEAERLRFSASRFIEASGPGHSAPASAAVAIQPTRPSPPPRAAETAPPDFHGNFQALLVW